MNKMLQQKIIKEWQVDMQLDISSFDPTLPHTCNTHVYHMTIHCKTLHWVRGEVIMDFDSSSCNSDMFIRTKCLLFQQLILFPDFEMMFLERVDLHKTSRRNMEVKLKKFEQLPDSSMKVSKSFSSLECESNQTKERD